MNGMMNTMDNTKGTIRAGIELGGQDAMDKFEYTTKTDARCEGCNNHCMRNIQTFLSGDCWISIGI